MSIFVGKNFDGYVESVVLAKSYELAQAFWQGQGLFPYSVDQWDEGNLKDHPTGVLPILKIKKKVIRPSEISSRTGYIELLVVEKG